MFIVDDVLLFPVSSILWIFRELHNAARQELASETENIIARLSELYMMLETEKITSDQFDILEKDLLDRLDEIEGRPVRARDEGERE
jgi:hypothetical protein